MYLGVFENQLRAQFYMIIFSVILRCSQNAQILTKIANPPLHGALSSLLCYFQKLQINFHSALQIAVFLHFFQFFP